MIMPWLLAILRNVCRSEYARRAEFVDAETINAEGVVPLWLAAQDSPETAALRRLETETMQRLVDTLSGDFGSARTKRPFVSRDRRCDRRAGGDGHVATGAGALALTRRMDCRRQRTAGRMTH
jgi:hypothetical protein